MAEEEEVIAGNGHLFTHSRTDLCVRVRARAYVKPGYQ